ncbi:MAG: hypothetical protein COB59_03155 [Rhodospirillaceae bacterium]|nr:MAG: hypothetical protein COB59_03155 [Rhodospirillaceae bacterium]
MIKNNAHKIGAVLYVLWGVLHIYFGVWMLYALNTEGAAAVIAIVGSGVPASTLPQSLDPVTAATIGQHAWNILWFGIFATVVGGLLNWKNSVAGYWANLVVVSAADAGFAVAIMIPGYIAMADGIEGPLLWIPAIIFSTIGILKNRKTQTA